MSFLPFGIIYLFSHFFYLIVYYLIPYRKKVVQVNVNNSFPNKSQAEKKVIVKNFYKYLTHLLAESIKNLSISETQLKKRMKVRNPALMDQLYQQGKSVLLLSSHFNNWEFLITSQNLLFKHKAIGIGTPLTNKFWDKKINERRERFGLKVVNAANYKQTLAAIKNEPTATLILGDQSPGKEENCYWMSFLNQQSAFFFGAEILANQTNNAVVYGVIHKVEKGHYEIELRTITENPSQEAYGYITKSYIQHLENDIQNNPAQWLWSHKRWKKKIPEDLSELKANHEKRFLERFRPKK